MVSEKDLIYKSEIRSKFEKRIDLLESIKKLPFIGTLKLLTVQQVAEYFDVPMNTVQKILSRHEEEFYNNLYYKSREEFCNLLKKSEATLTDNRYCVTATDGKVYLNVSNNVTRLLSLEGITKIGMMLTNSTIAHKFRKKIIFCDAQEEMNKEKEVEKEKLIAQKLEADRIRSYANLGYLLLNQQYDKIPKCIEKLKSDSNETLLKDKVEQLSYENESLKKQIEVLKEKLALIEEQKNQAITKVINMLAVTLNKSYGEIIALIDAGKQY